MCSFIVSRAEATYLGYFALSSQEWAPYRVPSVCLRKPAGDSPADLAASREEILAGIERLLQTRDV